MRKKLYICLLFMLFILPFKVSAATGSISISCADTKLSPGQTTNCTITGNSSVDIIDVSAVIELSNNLIMESFTLDEIWEGNDFDDGKIDIYTTSGDEITGNFTIGIMEVKVKDGAVNSDEKVALSSIEFTYDNNEYPISDAEASIRIPSNINTLSNLTVSGATFTFNPGVTTYDLNVDADSTTISATVTDGKSTITGDTGSKNLKYGLNTFTITVTAEDGTKKNYILNITKPDNRSTQKDMLNFEFIGNDINFDKDTINYNLIVENSINKIVFSSSCGADTLCINSSVINFSDITTYKSLLNEVNFEFKKNSSGNLNVGKNVLKIVVTAENESEKIYTFTINRKDVKGNLVDDEITTNSKTGDISIVIICFLGILFLGIGVYFYRRNNFSI